MKILFITPGIEDKAFGGPKGSIRNYISLKKYGDVTVYSFKRKSAVRSFLSLVKGYYPPIDETDYKEVEALHEKNHFDLVFFDTSIYGKIIDIFKNAKKVVFFHNCEYDYIQVRFGEKNGIKKFLYQKAIYDNERYILNNADYRVTFLARDSERLYEVYGKGADLIVPLGIEDKFSEGVSENVEEKSCLLFGAVGAANVEGYGWFVKNVAPYIHCKTIIAGKGFEEYKENWSSDKVEVIGYVDSLERLYSRASCVVVPLLSGGGMKVKVVEAFMFGKYVFGTDEAFAGFDIDGLDFAYRCNTPETFINKINEFITSNKLCFCEEARRVYKDNYGIESTGKLFDTMMRELDLME